jgi:hypothetical protein
MKEMKGGISQMLSATNGRVVHWISSLDDSGQCGLVDFQLVWVAFRVRNTQVQLQIAMHLLACFIGMDLMHLSQSLICRYVKFDTYSPAVERGLPITRVIRWVGRINLPLVRGPVCSSRPSISKTSHWAPVEMRIRRGSSLSTTEFAIGHNASLALPVLIQRKFKLIIVCNLELE